MAAAGADERDRREVGAGGSKFLLSPPIEALKRIRENLRGEELPAPVNDAGAG
jgi:hypothetical protein